MRKAEVTGSHLKRQAGISPSVKGAPQDGHPFTPSLMNVLDHNPFRLRGFDDTDKFSPQAASGSVNTGPPSSSANVLTGKASAHEIDALSELVAPCVLNVVEAEDSGPTLVKQSPSPWVAFAEGDSSHSSSLKAEREATDTGEEVEDI